MFTLTGSVYSYAKSMESQWKAEQKMKNVGGGQKATATTSATTAGSIASMINGQLGDNKQGTIYIKMMSGRKLTAKELEYLRENNPDLYTKAMKIKREREAYEKEIKRCRTKEEVRNANMKKMSSFIPEIRDARARGDLDAIYEINMRVNAIYDEHNTFTNSKAYKKLPDNYDELEERRKKGEKTGRPGVIVSLSEDVLKNEDKVNPETRKENDNPVRNKTGKAEAQAQNETAEPEAQPQGKTGQDKTVRAEAQARQAGAPGSPAHKGFDIEV